jgi:hypothetical protein
VEESSAALQLLQSTGHMVPVCGPVKHLTATILHTPSVTWHWEAQAVLKSSADDKDEGMRAKDQARFCQIGVSAEKIEKSEEPVAAGAELTIVGLAHVQPRYVS